MHTDTACVSAIDQVSDEIGRALSIHHTHTHMTTTTTTGQYEQNVKENKVS